MNLATDVYWMTQPIRAVPRDNDWLAPGERAVLLSRRVLKRRAEWRLGRWTAKRALRAGLAELLGARGYDDIEIRADDDGAPVALVRGRLAPVAISISHSHGVGLCAFSAAGARVGCDAELVEPRDEAFVSDYFTRAERAWIGGGGSASRAERTTLLWSAKESVLKALRVGLRRDPRSVAVEVCLPPRARGWGEFRARIEDLGDILRGWWRLQGGYAYTVVLEEPR